MRMRNDRELRGKNESAPDGMLASHPRLGEASPIGMLNDNLLETIALLSLS